MDFTHAFSRKGAVECVYFALLCADRFRRVTFNQHWIAWEDCGFLILNVQVVFLASQVVEIMHDFYSHLPFFFQEITLYIFQMFSEEWLSILKQKRIKVHFVIFKYLKIVSSSFFSWFCWNLHLASVRALIGFYSHSGNAQMRRWLWSHLQLLCQVLHFKGWVSVFCIAQSHKWTLSHFLCRKHIMSAVLCFVLKTKCHYWQTVPKVSELGKQDQSQATEVCGPVVHGSLPKQTQQESIALGMDEGPLHKWYHTVRTKTVWKFLDPQNCSK